MDSNKINFYYDKKYIKKHSRRTIIFFCIEIISIFYYLFFDEHSWHESIFTLIITILLARELLFFYKIKVNNIYFLIFNNHIKFFEIFKEKIIKIEDIIEFTLYANKEYIIKTKEENSSSLNSHRIYLDYVSKQNFEKIGEIIRHKMNEKYPNPSSQ